MAIIVLPASVRIATIQWTLDRPSQRNRSQWTGRDQVRANPWHARWSASVALAPIVGEENVLAWRAFLAAVKGQVNTFRLPATEGPQMSISPTITVGGGLVSTSVNQFSTTGWPAATTLNAGRMITVSDQLLVLTSDMSSGGGTAAIAQFEGSLRSLPANGTAVEVKNPTALVAMASSQISWSVAPGKVYGIQFQVEERF